MIQNPIAALRMPIASPNIIKMMLVEGEYRPLPPQLDQGVASLCEEAEQLSARMPRNSKQARIQVTRQKHSDIVFMEVSQGADSSPSPSSRRREGR